MALHSKLRSHSYPHSLSFVMLFRQDPFDNSTFALHAGLSCIDIRSYLLLLLREVKRESLRMDICLVHLFMDAM